VVGILSATEPPSSSLRRLKRLVRAAGHEPLERDTFYNIVNVPQLSKPDFTEPWCSRSAGHDVALWIAVVPVNADTSPLRMVGLQSYPRL